ncbi:hypothetical protein LBMAG27_25180 [Bacteroidota bacterium]|nr:hypothetical protein LBMAG27_25180 [Bacteroidota bacterium]
MQGLKTIIIIIGVIVIITIIGTAFQSAMNSIVHTFTNLPWYISIPLLSIIIYTIYKIGKDKYWW